jgi:hypothetical protein
MNPQLKEAIEEAAKKKFPIYNDVQKEQARDFQVYSCGFREGITAFLQSPSLLSLAGLQPVQEWIRVEDKLPEGEVLLLTTSKAIIIGDWYKDKWRSPGRWHWDAIGQQWHSDFQTQDITHWQPLPSPPQSNQP